MWPTHYLPNRERVDGIPPPRIYLTSQPYPYELYEEMTCSGSFISATPGIGAEESFTSLGSFISGTLTQYQFGDVFFEDELESVGSFVSGTLVERKKTRDVGREELESVGSFVSGTMAEPLVIYDNWPLAVEFEDLISTGSFVSGVLT